MDTTTARAFVLARLLLTDGALRDSTSHGVDCMNTIVAFKARLIDSKQYSAEAVRGGKAGAAIDELVDEFGALHADSAE